MSRSPLIGWRRRIPFLLFRYGLAIVSVASAVVTVFILQRFRVRDPFALVLLSAFSITVWYGGSGPGILAFLLSIFGLSFFLHSPDGWPHIILYDIPTYCIFILSSFLVYRFSMSRRHAEQLLEDNRNRLESEVIARTSELRRRDLHLTEAQCISHTGSWAWNESTGEGYWSPGLYRILGIASDAVPPSPAAYMAQVHPDDQTGFESDWAQALRCRGSFDRQYRMVQPDGSIRHVRVWGRPSPSDRDDLEFIGTVMDVTEQVEDRAVLQRHLKTIEDLLEEKKTLQEQLRRENISLHELTQALQSEIASIQKTRFEKIVGSSPAIRRTLVRVNQVAPTNSTVLITGETGTGKELIAQAIHDNSSRADKPFISVNCAAVPSTLIAAELFGSEKGAFTGADRQRLGRFELAANGTLFLDEIGELPLETQASLLRVLEERTLERLGGTKPIPIDVRVIAATNRDLQAAMRTSEFRQDLFYRLNMFPIDVPPLRERREDIPELVSHFISLSAAKHGKTIRNIEKRGMDLLRSYNWPGNIRELRNVIDTSVILSSGEVLTVDEELLFGTGLGEDAPIGSLEKEMANHERILIERALEKTQGRVYGPAGAAAILHMPPTTLSARIKVLKIDTTKFKGR
jgi:DNA-binding NtrC family response regulator/PAS domain-containing protein